MGPGRAIYVVHDPERAGSALVRFAMADLDTHEQRLRGAGLAVTEQAARDAPRRLVVADPDGNTLTLFQDPAPSPT